jgi:diguanylate cyclase (GGDEF)-like protein
MWSAFATSSAAQTSRKSGALFDAYMAARFSVAAEESLERKYRLDPSRSVLSAHADAKSAVDRAMVTVAAIGTAGDKAIAADVRHRNNTYEQEAKQLFQAVDSRDFARADEIDLALVDPVFAGLENTVYRQANLHADSDADAVTRLVRVELIARWATSLAVIVGLLLITAFAWLRRRSGREQAAAAALNAYRATHDALTGLPNRLLFTRTLDSSLVTAEQARASVAVVLLDLDRFKEVNDTLGHHIGDELLRQIGQRIRQVLVAENLLARLGGDEFAILITTAGNDAAALAAQEQVVQRVQAALDAAFVVGDVALAVEASAGIARYPQDGDSSQLLLQRADIAMYQAKRNQERLAVYDQTFDDHNLRKLCLLADLRKAEVHDELLLHYQPLVDIQTSAVTGVEALVRWRHPAEGLLSPAEFIPLAESSGYIQQLTRWVLTKAVSDAQQWAQIGIPLVVSVNISARCLIDSNLPETVAGILTAVGLPPELLKLEITESAIVADPVRAQEVITRLHRLGIALSMDDFGTGYTSLANLRDLPIQEIKIDPTFVSRMLFEERDAAIVRTTIELAKRLGMQTVAEGVDDPAILPALAAMGCTTAQGYYLSRPLPFEGLLEWLTAWSRFHQPTARQGTSAVVVTGRH